VNGISDAALLSQLSSSFSSEDFTEGMHSFEEWALNAVLNDDLLEVDNIELALRAEGVFKLHWAKGKELTPNDLWMARSSCFPVDFQ